MIKKRFTHLALASCIVISIAGCRQDMHNQPKYVPLRSSEFFPNGRSAQEQVNGTIARGELHENAYFYSGKIGNKEQDTFPFAITEAVMERGRERYDIYCSPCHSRVGDGNGMIVKRGYRQAANFHDQKYLTQPVGHFYDVISHGWGAMPDYASQIEPADRWAIAAYIRALQSAQSGSMADVPADQRGSVKDVSQITLQGMPVDQALASGGKGSSEGLSGAGAYPDPAMIRQIEGSGRPKDSNPPQDQHQKDNKK